MGIFNDGFLKELLLELMKRIDKLVEWKMKEAERQYMSVKEAAKYCGVSRTTFETTFAEAGLRPIVIPGFARKLYSKKVLDEFMMAYQR